MCADVRHSWHGVDMECSLYAARSYPGKGDRDVAESGSHGVVGSHGQIQHGCVPIQVLPILQVNRSGTSAP